MNVRRTWRALACGVIAAGLLAGCGDDPGDGNNTEDRAGHAGTWTPSDDPVENRGLAWAADGVVHLGDGSTIDTGSTITDFVVAGDGVYFMSSRDSELELATEDGTTSTGVSPDPDTLATSPDGQYLAFIEYSGEEDRFGTHVAEAVVVDLAAGEEVLRSSEGMGDADTDADLADLYEELPPEVYGVDDETAYVATTDKVLGFDLATGDSRVVNEDPSGVADTAWYPQFTGQEQAANPSGTWRIVAQGDPPRLRSDDGQVVTTRLTEEDLGVPPWEVDEPPSWRLDSWLDDATAVGRVDLYDTTGGDLTIPITCTTTSGRCVAVPGTSDGVVLPENNITLVRTPIR